MDPHSDQTKENEQARFKTLHAQCNKQDELFDSIIKAAGVTRVQQHNNQLASVLRLSEINSAEQSAVGTSLAYFITLGHEKILDKLQKRLKITDQTTKETLLRCAHFVRFPKYDASKYTADQMLAHLEGSKSPARPLDAAQTIDWSTNIVQEDFNAKYQNHNLIVIPTLNTLNEFTGLWRKTQYRAPYTLIIGPTMCGKTQLLKELATHVTVSEFFSSLDIRNKDPRCQLNKWYNYSFQINKTDSKDKFNVDVAQAMNELKSEKDGNPEKSLVDAAKDVPEKLNFGGGKPLKVLLAIDEASNLINCLDAQLQIPYFQLFQQVLSTIPDGMGFFSVFTDTTLRVANFSPALTHDPSARFHELGINLFAPIYKISALNVLVPEAPSSWDQLLSPERLYSYGCPFHGLYFKGILVKKPYAAVDTTAKIAKTKLLLRSRSDPAELSSPQCFAILGSLIQTRLSLHSPINAELVSTADAVLARAEARWIECIDTLATAVQKGLVALGDAGEMATRLILIRAMQQTKPIHCKFETIPHGYSVRLSDFLRTLSGKDPETMDFGFNDEEHKIKLLEEGRIFFNHFTRILYTPKANDFLEFLYQGLAVQCRSRQPGLDDLFTIYLEPSSEPSELDLKNITFCGVQTKNCAGPVQLGESAKWFKSYAGIEGITNPYLILLFSLGSDSKLKKPKKPTEPNVTKPVSEKWHQPTDSDDTKRVYYQFLGLEEIYCLTPPMRKGLNRLIDAILDDLMNLHDDCDGNTAEWVKQLYPAFYPRATEQPTPSSPEQRKDPPPTKRCKKGPKGKK
ncbi:hypothetical protein PTTG_27056 [Puccinia triticina 1-1 BBBD Race 1]|uniref:Uncharacterized protein n=1 Tax=Puccinia triticina (isolate 1-1 / race 1 (BBBD)) TaxID=630390 RepID=A0A180GNP8_PUCT1|nr:hypothetical protein PTTG_27056 [Puccinia triticina 1-1 BBBD Race 1]